MNRAQAVISLGEGCFEWREDAQPCPRRARPRSAFVRALHDYHRALGNPLELTPRQRSRLRSHELAAEAVNTLMRCRERLNIGQLCSYLGIREANHGTESRMLRRVMDRLCDTGAVRSFGSYRKLYESAHEN